MEILVTTYISRNENEKVVFVKIPNKMKKNSFAKFYNDNQSKLSNENKDMSVVEKMKILGEKYEKQRREKHL